MGDIKALELLSNELNKLKAIPKPPTTYSESGKYKKNTEKVLSQCDQTMIDVSQYTKRINESIDTLRAAIKDQTSNIQKAIKKALDSIKYGTGTIPSNVMQYVRELQQTSKSIIRLEEFMLEKENIGVTMDDIDKIKDGTGTIPSNVIQCVRELQQTAKSMTRLEEFMLETENVFGKIQENIGVTMDDIDKLKGCLESWKLENDENYEEEKRRLEAERLAREEAERKRREEAERRRKEEEERRKKEDEERKKREEEERERKRREEEERRLEEERRRKEEEERLKHEEEERKRKEEEERKRKEEEEKLKREEEDRRKRELERQRLEAIKREKERKEKEEAARKWRLDPNNWNNKLYKRSDDQVDSNKAYHKNVCCVISTPPSPEDKSPDNHPDLECLASDEVDDIIETLNDGEKIASSIINLKSNSGEVTLEAPVRAFLPYCQVTDPNDELIMKVSVNGSDWVHSTPFLPTQAVISEYGSKLLGAEIDRFEDAKLVIVARRKSQTIIVDKPGISQYSSYDKNIKIIVPRDAVAEPTELTLSIKPVTDEVLANISKENQDCDSISNVSSLIVLTCQRPLNKGMEIDLMKTGQRSGTTRSYYVYRTLENIWKMAEIEYKGRNQDVSVTLPAGKYKYSLLQIDLPPSVPKDNSLSIAESIYAYLNNSVVRVVFRQNRTNPAMGIVTCVRRDQVNSKLVEMDELGYNLGPGVSREFSIPEGQRIIITSTGNIDIQDTDNGKIIVPFFAYMDTAKETLVLDVKDQFKQRDMQEYMGNLVCTINEQNGSSFEIVLPVTIPKLEKMKFIVKTTAVRFPYFLFSLAHFLAWKLTERGDGIWESMVERLESKSALKRLYRRAKARVDDDTNEKAICRVVILDWMKTTDRKTDKVGRIEKALEGCGFTDLKQECHAFVTYQKEHLSNAKLAEFASKLSGNIEEISKILELGESVTKKIVDEHPNDSFDQKEACLQAWRSGETCVRSGTNAVERLKELLSI